MKVVPKIHFVIPVLNEAPNIERLVRGLRDTIPLFGGRFGFHFIVVDDGSTDGTGDLARKHFGELEHTVLRHETNRGPGYAFGTAFEHLAGMLGSEDFVVTMEGDNTSRQELLKQMFTRSEEGYDVILASPYMYGGGIGGTTVWRTFISHVANLFVKEALGIHGIVTMSSFYRVYRASVIRTLQAHYGPRILERTGFESMIEMLLKMIYLKTTISEVPMVLTWALRAGKSKMKVLRTMRGYLTLWFEKGKWVPRAAVVPLRDGASARGRDAA